MSLLQSFASVVGFLHIFVLSLISVGLLGLAAAYLYFQWRYRYWKNQNIKTTKPMFPLGDITEVGFSKHIGTVFKEIYDQFKGERYNGMWVIHRPYIMVRDPDLIKTMFIRDFNHFRDRGLYVNEKIDPLSANLFFLGGSKWRNLRTKISPNFTSNKMRKMFQVMTEKGGKLREILRQPAEDAEEIRAKEYTVRYTHEVVASCILGLQADSIQNPKSVFRRLGRKVFEPSWSTIIKAAFSFLVPDLAALLRGPVILRYAPVLVLVFEQEFSETLKHFPGLIKKEHEISNVLNLTQTWMYGIVATPPAVTDFFLRAVRDVMEFREANGVKTSDFMQLLVQLKNQGYLEEADHNGNEKAKQSKKCKFTFNNAVAQAFIFWVGGFETSATTMQFALYEMSKNLVIQDRARNEIRRVIAKYNGEVTYEGVLEMEYLGRVVDETLRKYPPVTILNRVCTQTYKIPDSDVVIEEGVPVLIPVLGIHMDPEYFPDPEKFDPDRFTEEQKSMRHHYTYLPFGEGPHACIGQRFALLQIKAGLANLLSSYKFDVTDNTPAKPICSRKLIIYTVKHGIPLKISRLEE